MIGREDEVRGYRDRVALFHFIMLGMFGLIAGRLVYLQILKGDELRKFSEANRLKKEKLLPTRGIIFDRNGKVIVDNRAAFDVVLLSQYYPFTPASNKRLAKALGMTDEELEHRLGRVNRMPSFYPVLLKADVTKDILAAIEMDAQGFPGIDIEPTVQRRYPYGETAAQLLGYVGEVDVRDIKNDPTKSLLSGDYIGKMGIERNYDQYLRGMNGVGYVEVDAMGRRKKTEGAEKLLGFVAQTEPVPGNNIYLTIDADVEAAAENALKSRNLHGSIVAIDPRNGEILALVNAPSYEPGMISGRDVNPKVWAELSTNKERPLRNRAIQDIYPPGSTFKPFMAIAALAEGVATVHTSVNCAGSMAFGNRRFACWKHHGPTDFYKAIQSSCDVFFYHMGIQMGIDLVAKYARLFGLGAPTGIRISGEQRGLIPDSEWKKKVYHDIWHPGETLSVSIGQGYVSVTPIQMAAAYGAIGNGGFLYKPYLIRRIEGRGGEPIKEFQPELTRKIDIPSEVFEAVKEGLFRVVNVPGGTAYVAARSKIAQISGKTGTAQVRAFADIAKIKNCMELPYLYRHHGWFVGYAPRDNPQIAVAVVSEHACHGTASGPIAREVIEAFVKKQALLAGKPLTEIEPVKKETKAPPVLNNDEADEEDAVVVTDDVEVPGKPDSIAENAAKKASAAKPAKPQPETPAQPVRDE